MEKINQKIGDEIKDLYINGNSSIEIKKFILEKYNISVSAETVTKKLRCIDVKIRSGKEAQIIRFRKKEPINEILSLYRKNVQIRELSRRLKVSRKTISKILRENNIRIRDSRTALIAMGHIKEKKKFNLDYREKAYLFGLVMGDLTPVNKSNYTLKLITHSSHLTFIRLLYKNFKKYGPVSYKLNKQNQFRFCAYLDRESFSFLLDTKTDKIPNLINSQNFFNFLAGFIDSDGSVIIRKSGIYFQYVIRFFGQNLNLLLEVKGILEEMNYHLSIHKSHSKGDISFHKGVKFQYNRDYYVLETYKKEETLDLLEKIPIRHPEKLAKKDLIFRINKRREVLWFKIEEETKKLKSVIQQSVKLRTDLNLKMIG